MISSTTYPDRVRFSPFNRHDHDLLYCATSQGSFFPLQSTWSWSPILRNLTRFVCFSFVAWPLAWLYQRDPPSPITMTVSIFYLYQRDSPSPTTLTVFIFHLYQRDPPSPYTRQYSSFTLTNMIFHLPLPWQCSSSPLPTWPSISDYPDNIHLSPLPTWFWPSDQPAGKVGWWVKPCERRVVSEEVLAGTRSQEVGEEGDYTQRYIVTTSTPPTLRWASTRDILMLYLLWGEKSQDSVHRSQLLKREESRREIQARYVCLTA